MITNMKKLIYTLPLILAFLACTKENPESGKPQEPEVKTSDIEALRQEIAELREQVQALTPSEGGQVDEGKWALASELESLKEENEQLKAQIADLNSTFFEVDGLRFDKNGDVISTPKVESTYEKQTNTGKLTMERTFDAQGRLIETYGRYSGYNSVSNPPYYWQRIKYEYNGKTVKKSSETSSYSYGIYTHEESSETTYW